MTNNEHCKTKIEGFWSEMWSAAQCQEDGVPQHRGTDQQLCRGLDLQAPFSSFPSTSSVGKTFIDLHCTGDSWNPKKRVVEVSGRPTVLVVPQAATLVSHPYSTDLSWSQCDIQDRALQTHPPHQTHPTHLHLSNQRQQSPSGCPAHLTPSALQKRKAIIWGWQEQR